MIDVYDVYAASALSFVTMSRYYVTGGIASIASVRLAISSSVGRGKLGDSASVASVGLILPQNISKVLLLQIVEHQTAGAGFPALAAPGRTCPGSEKVKHLAHAAWYPQYLSSVSYTSHIPPFLRALTEDVPSVDQVRPADEPA